MIVGFIATVKYVKKVTTQLQRAKSQGSGPTSYVNSKCTQRGSERPRMMASEWVSSLNVWYWLGRNPHSLIRPQFRETWNTFIIPWNSFTRKNVMTHSASTCRDNTRDCHSKAHTKFLSWNVRAKNHSEDISGTQGIKFRKDALNWLWSHPVFQGGGCQIQPLHIKKVCIKSKNVHPVEPWTGPEGSRRLRLSDFKTIGTWRW